MSFPTHSKSVAKQKLSLKFKFVMDLINIILPIVKFFFYHFLINIMFCLFTSCIIHLISRQILQHWNQKNG